MRGDSISEAVKEINCVLWCKHARVLAIAYQLANSGSVCSQISQYVYLGEKKSNKKPLSYLIIRKVIQSVKTHSESYHYIPS